MLMASIQKRGENSWLLVVEAGYNEKGKRIKKTRTIRVEDKALLKTTKRLREHLEGELHKFKIEVEAGEYIAPEKMKFVLFSEEWKAKYAVKEYSITTFSKYEGHLKNHILPVFGHKSLNQIKTIHIIDFIDALSKPEARKDGKNTSLSTATIHDVYKVIKNIFNKAVEWKLIGKNPMEGVKKPSIEESEMNYYDENEASELIAALSKETRMWRLYFLGAMNGGLRRGELLALEFTDIDYDDSTISITKNIPKSKNGQPIIKVPKTKKSTRVVVMPEWYMNELKQYEIEWKQNKLALGNLWEEPGRKFLFHSGFGKAIYFTTPTGKWRKIVKKHNLKPIRLHDLRHTMVTLLIEAGENLKVIQERAGHASLKITSDTYGHLTKKVNKAAASKFDKFDPQNKNRQQSVNN